MEPQQSQGFPTGSGITKKAYQKPVLDVYGDVRKMTTSNRTRSSADAGGTDNKIYTAA